MVRLTALFAVLLAVVGVGPATAAEPCDFDAYLAAGSTDGVPVRARPEPAAPVLAVLPASDPHDPDQGFTPSLRVTAIADGWAEVRDVVVGAYRLEEVEELFPGPGWIPADRITTGFSADRFLRAAPSDDAAVVLEMRGEDWGADSVAIDVIRGCRGRWIEVGVTAPDGRTASGWGTAVCGNQATTCN